MPPRTVVANIDPDRFQEYLEAQERALREAPTGPSVGPQGRGPAAVLGFEVDQPGGWMTDPVSGERFYRDQGADYTDETKRILLRSRQDNLELIGKTPLQQFQNEQLKALKQQQSLEKELEPFIFESMGIWKNPATGKIEKLPPKELTPEQLEDKKLNDLYKEHLNASIEGRLPVSLATQKTLKEQEETLDEAMSRRLGTKWRESTPGIRRAGDFMLSSEATKEAERFGDLNRATGLLNQREASLSDITARRLGQLEGMGSPLFSLANSYGTAQQPYLFQNLLNVRMDNQASANKAGDTAGLYKLAGAAIGAGTYYGYNKYKNPTVTPPQQ